MLKVAKKQHFVVSPWIGIILQSLYYIYVSLLIWIIIDILDKYVHFLVYIFLSVLGLIRFKIDEEYFLRYSQLLNVANLSNFLKIIFVFKIIGIYIYIRVQIYRNIDIDTDLWRPYLTVYMNMQILIL